MSLDHVLTDTLPHRTSHMVHMVIHTDTYTPRHPMWHTHTDTYTPQTQKQIHTYTQNTHRYPHPPSETHRYTHTQIHTPPDTHTDTHTYTDTYNPPRHTQEHATDTHYPIDKH